MEANNEYDYYQQQDPWTGDMFQDRVDRTSHGRRYVDGIVPVILGGPQQYVPENMVEIANRIKEVKNRNRFNGMIDIDARREK